MREKVAIFITIYQYEYYMSENPFWSLFVFIIQQFSRCCRIIFLLFLLFVRGTNNYNASFLNAVSSTHKTEKAQSQQLKRRCYVNMKMSWKTSEKNFERPKFYGNHMTNVYINYSFYSLRPRVCMSRTRSACNHRVRKQENNIRMRSKILKYNKMILTCSHRLLLSAFVRFHSSLCTLFCVWARTNCDIMCHNIQPKTIIFSISMVFCV